jgi:phosphohistidine swiveling domain-containing protein
VVFSAERAREFTSNGYRVVLFRKDTSPDDLPGMLVADAIVTAIGGETSHAAVVARGLNKPAVVGCRSLSIDRTGVFVDTRYLNEGEMVSVSGDTGEVVLGTVPLLSREPWGEVANFLRWMRQFAPQHPRGVPCLRFEYLEQFISMNRVLQDFYLSDAMAKVAERSSLAEEARALRTRIHGEAADMVSCYLAVAVAGEVRHACSHEWRGALLAEDPTKSAYLILRDVYGAIDERRKEERLIAQTKAASQLQYKSLQDPIMFLRACADVFDHDAWGSSYGGRKWSRIARAVVQYLSKEVDATIFVDHAFDLRHNGGALFDKHRMTSSRTCEHHLSWQLEQKKFSTSIEDLFDRFKQMSYGYSEDVSRLWEKGSNCGLWSPRKVHHV